MAPRRQGLAIVGALVAGALSLLVAPVGAASPAVEGDVVAVGDAVALPTKAFEDAVGIVATPLGLGWWAASSDGRVAAAGDALPLGDLAGRRLNQPVVGVARTPSGGGYWLVASDGGVFSFGDARFHGSTGALRLNEPIVGMAATPSGGGYWLVASDGGVFSFGDARFYGSTGALRLNEPIVGMASVPSGRGYWLAASDGGLFTFGDAVFRGTGRGPITAITASASGGGYWLVGADGHVDALGDAAPVGDAGPVDGAVMGLAPTPSGAGYWLVVGRVRDIVTVFEPGGLSGPVQQWALDAARRAGAKATVYHSGNLDLLAVRRGSDTVQAAPAGWRIPMTAIAVDHAAAAPLVGRIAAGVVARGELVLGRATAEFRGAAVGDDVDLLGWDGAVHTLRVGAVVSDRRVGATELILSTGRAASIGFRRPISVKLWGAARERIDAGLAAAAPPAKVGIGRTWDRPDPDDVAPLIRLKQVLGEPSYRPGRGGDELVLHPAFTNGIRTARVPIIGAVTCHRAIFGPLTGALDEVARAGLAGGLGRYGGCYVPRLVRGGDSGGSPSRHSYGIAADVNITNNTFGGRVSMDPRIVDIFRRWGFAWGGTWTRADGMHFEWRALP